jgi:hypothetical protein
MDQMWGSSLVFVSDITYQYWYGFYHSAVLLGINEVLPVTTMEYAFCGFGMLASALMLANTFGMIAILVAQLSEKT